MPDYFYAPTSETFLRFLPGKRPGIYRPDPLLKKVRDDEPQIALINSTDTREELVSFNNPSSLIKYSRIVNNGRTITTIVENPNQSVPDYPVGQHLKTNMKFFEIYSNNLNDAIKKLGYNDRPVNLICMGSSGAIVATVLAQRLRTFNTIIHIKKNGENSHCSLHDQIRDIGPNDINIIVDDFISSGTTIKNCVSQFNDQVRNSDKSAKLHGICIGGNYHARNSNFERIKFEFVVCRQYFEE